MGFSMSKFRLKLVAALILVALNFSNFQVVYGCVYDPIRPVFSFDSRPDDALIEFANGNLGILKPDYARSYLIVAYRILNGYNFTDNEKVALVKLWNYRLGLTAETDENPAFKNYDEQKKALTNWLNIRNKIPEIERIEADNNIFWRNNEGEYDFFLNCNKSSFQTAAETLANRQSKYEQKDVVEWVKGQDAVFSNCNKAGSIPENLSAEFPEWLRKDREYQIASALFYAGKLEESRIKYEEIAKDLQSVWQNTANYMIARTYLRQASFEKNQAEDFLVAAEKKALQIISDPSQSKMHSNARELLYLVANRSKSEKHFQQYSKLLSQNVESNDLGDEVETYISYLDYHGFKNETPKNAIKPNLPTKENPTIWQRIWRYLFGEAKTEESFQSPLINNQTESKSEEDEYPYTKKLRNSLHFYTDTKFSEISEIALQNEISEWIFSFQANDKDSFEHCYAKWIETSKIHWLLAAVSNAENEYENIDKLLIDSEAVPVSSPAFQTISYHAIRLLIERKEYQKARTKLDKILNDKRIKLPVSARNNFYQERMLTAKNLDEFLKFAQRKAVAFTHNSSYDETEQIMKEEDRYWEKRVLAWRNNQMFDEDSIKFFNESFSLSGLIKAGENSKLPSYLRKNILISAYVRSVLLDRKDIQKRSALQLSQVAPEMREEMQNFLNSPDELNAFYPILKFPVMRPFVMVGFGRFDIPSQTLSVIGDNWWSLAGLKYEEKYIQDALELDYLNENEKNEARNERNKLIFTGNSSDFLTQKALKLADEFPQSQLIPELLHYAVKTTRYGDRSENIGALSQTAFKLLHKKYPNNEWTRKTPFWFN